MIEMRNDGNGTFSILAYGHIYAEGLTMEQARAIWKELVMQQKQATKRNHGNRRIYAPRGK